MRFIFTLVLGLGLLTGLQAQQISVSGKLLDAQDQSPIIGAAISLVSARDTTRSWGNFSDVTGNFSITLPRPGNYLLKISYVGYQSVRHSLQINETQSLGTLTLKTDAKLLDEVTVAGKQVRAEQKGDTTQFNADAYKVNKDATAEELITKMPGFTNQNGRIEAQGETVRRVTIDGQEFFGEDANAALKNLPAEIIEKVQVFDRLSDQAQFSGFNDGNTEKSINIVTRSGKNNGQFGKVFGGYGTDNTYSAGGNVNYFKKARRISIIGLTNNINIQNFATEDLLGALGNTNTRGGAGGGGRSWGGGGGGAQDFLVSPTGGITRTHALGINYSDQLSKKAKISASYFLNDAATQTQVDLTRLLFLPNQQVQEYTETSTGERDNANHRFSARLEYNPTMRDQIIFSPRGSWQGNQTVTNLAGENELNSQFLSSLSTLRTNDGQGWSTNTSLLYNHRMEKRGRTFSTNVGLNINSNLTDGTLLSENRFARLSDEQVIDQISTNSTRRNSYSVRTDYTEPLSEKAQLRFGYEGSWTLNSSDRKTRDFEESTNGYTLLNPTLTNVFSSDYNLHRGSSSIRINSGQKLMMNANISVQTAQLTGDQTFPFSFDISRNFLNVLPSAFVRYNVDNSKNFRFFYRTNVNAPSVSQLQPVVDNSNPLQLRAGNQDLDQEYNHSGSLRYSATNIKKGTSFYANLNASIVLNNITNSNFIASRDTLIQGVLLNRGSQLTRPINYGNSWNIRSFSTYGFPVKALKSNLNVNGGISYTLTPGLINGQENLAQNTALNGGMVLSSNINEFIDYSVSYQANYSLIRNSLRPDANNNFFTQNVIGKVNLQSKKGAIFQLESASTTIRGLGEGFDRTFTLVNASVGQKFGKDKRAEAKLTTFDLLNQNNAIARQLTEAFVEDTRSLILQRYVMVTVTYFIRNFR